MMPIQLWRSGVPGLLALSLAGLLPAATVTAAEPVQAVSKAQGEGIGAITSVQGKVLMDHPDPAAPFQAKTTDNLQFNDVIETHGQSRTKAVLHSGSILTVGENSRIEIVEHQHDAAHPEPSVTIKLVQGSLRVLVGSAFAAPGAKFEVQTPAGRALAHGGTFVIWADKETSGAANIGTAAAIEFTSAGQTARLAPGEYTHAAPGGAPKPAALIEAAAHPMVRETIEATHLRESLRHEAPKDALREIGAPRAIGLGLGGAAGAAAEGIGSTQSQSQVQSAGVDQAQGGGENAGKAKAQAQVQHRAATPNPNRTPPSVHSGAANKLLRPHEGVPLRGSDRVR